ncbi:adhesin domain protein [Escherichia coli DEC7B]|nr:adhesin domain protein [Escherichia coli DEC7B]
MKANFTLSDGDKAVTDADGKAKVTLKGTISRRSYRDSIDGWR